MKKWMLFGLVFGLGGLLWAATLNLPANPPISVLTLTQIAASTPTYTGNVVVCSNCTQANSGLGVLCISTEATTAQNAYILAGSSQTALTTCK